MVNKLAEDGLIANRSLADLQLSLQHNSMLSRIAILLLGVCVASAQIHAPDKAPVINRELGWCDNGAITRTTGECVCSSHRGFFCKDSLGSVSDGKKTCEAGYGISFFHFTCETCQCVNKVRIDELAGADGWKERKNALKNAKRKQQVNVQ